MSREISFPPSSAPICTRGGLMALIYFDNYASFKENVVSTRHSRQGLLSSRKFLTVLRTDFLAPQALYTYASATVVASGCFTYLCIYVEDLPSLKQAYIHVIPQRIPDVFILRIFFHLSRSRCPNCLLIRAFQKAYATQGWPRGTHRLIHRFQTRAHSGYFLHRRLLWMRSTSAPASVTMSPI